MWVYEDEGNGFFETSGAAYPVTQRTEFSVEIMLLCNGPKQEMFFKFQPALKGIF
jgi:hypothetical protein